MDSTIDTEPARRRGARADEALRFGGFRLRPAARALHRLDGTKVRLGDRAFDILLALTARPGQVVGSQELFGIVWPGRFVEESNLRVHVAALRRALGDQGGAGRLIANIPGRGYAFLGEVVAEHASAGEAAAPPRGSVPPPTRLIGRDETVHAIAEDLRRRRLVTVTGAGGIGKTAVALAVAARIADAYPDGVHFLDLGGIDRDAEVVPQLASLLRLPISDGDPLRGVLDHLRPRRLLLVLDNCEHLVGAASRLAEEILATAPGLHLLATSREPLRAAGEWVHRLAPLDVPPQPLTTRAEELLRFSAVQLLVERVTACDAAFVLIEADMPLAAELCARLDGLPLAIELAAPRVAVLGLAAVLARLDERFRLLTNGRRNAAERHRTLGAMIEWSHDTLTPAEQVAYRRLSVLRGAFTLEAGCRLAGEAAEEEGALAAIIGDLVEKSLLSVENRERERRYRMLESIRLHAAAKLAAAGEEARFRRRHADYFHGRALAYGRVTTLSTEEWLVRHRGDAADLRAALDWAFSAEGDAHLATQLAAASAPFWFKLMLVPELRGWLERAIRLARSAPGIEDAVVLRLHAALGHAIFHTQGPVPEVAEVLEEGLRLARRAGEEQAALRILWALFGHHSTRGDLAAAFDCVARIGAVADATSDPEARLLHDRVSALAHHLAGDQARSLMHARRALARPAPGRPTQGESIFFYDHQTSTRSHYARALWVSGLADQAMAVVEEAIAEAAVIDQPFAFGYFLVFGACPVALWRGELEVAQALVGRVLDVASGITSGIWQRGGRLYEHVIALLQAPEAERALRLQRLVADFTLTPFQADSLGTVAPFLLQRESVARATTEPPQWCTAEILRAEGERLLRDAPRDGAAAEALLRRSLGIARAQGALGWELRGAASLARLCRAQGRVAEAEDVLGDVLSRFREGFATRDLRRAATLLQALRQPAH
ncbi:hypothetical protein GXW74_15395 [Roseomonas eburnea]|uniref:OmpR/PhoB-type domain-containing protein n=1 Tax=Neoroseomonas eburnea TaxID=1346889 RepID=A0A9X9XDU2_9PROT|nr:winged helix-turn-helix domain-containing protein [Neoroseomonas eburnea]MBR0681878.1 hypothetical protein [Neoroseomonas eburnea]